jgi:transmembrane sensor
MTDFTMIGELIFKRLQGSITIEESVVLDQWSAESDANQELIDSFNDENILASKLTDFHPDNRILYRNQILKKIQQKQKAQQLRKPVHRVHFLKTAWFRYASAILIILGIGSYILFSKKSVHKPIVVAAQNKQPGSDKATLTLSDGRQIILDNSNKENIADGRISIEKADGIITYNTASTIETSAREVFNIMNTPRGGQYQLVLPDGSKVWLNSASSLKYPTVFQGKNRIVELSGEAYFDIKENKKNPFIVKTQKADVLVLGTEFNINSYSDEPDFSATLINGSVKISNGNDSMIISPGQQAQIKNSSSNILELNNDVDINQVTAWRKGIFEFKETTLDAISRQLTRWYDVEVLVEKGSRNLPLSGGITRKTSLENVLKILAANGVNHKWQNGKIKIYAE